MDGYVWILISAVGASLAGIGLGMVFTRIRSKSIKNRKLNVSLHFDQYGKYVNTTVKEID